MRGVLLKPTIPRRSVEEIPNPPSSEQFRKLQYIVDLTLICWMQCSETEGAHIEPIALASEFTIRNLLGKRAPSLASRVAAQPFVGDVLFPGIACPIVGEHSAGQPARAIVEKYVIGGG